MKYSPAWEDSYLYKWYFELEMSMKRLTILLYLLSFSAGPVAHDTWSTLRPPDPGTAACFQFGQLDSDLVNGLLELEVALVGSSRAEKDCSQFDNDRVTLLLRSEPRNPFDIMQKGSCCIIDRKFIKEKEGGLGLVEKVESEFEEDDDLEFVGGGRQKLRLPNLDGLKAIFVHSIIGSPRIWHPGFNLFDLLERPDELEFPYWAKSFLGRWSREAEPDFFKFFQTMMARVREEYSKEQDKHEKDEAALLFFWESIAAQGWVRNRFLRENVFFRISRFIWNPPNPDVFIFKDQALKFLRRELFADEEIEMSYLDPESKSELLGWVDRISPLRAFLEDPGRFWFLWDQKKVLFKLLIYRQRYFRPIRANSSLFQGSFRSKTRYESLRYLTNLFLSNGTLLYQMIRALLRKRWIFPEEMKHAICVSITGEGFPIP